jgi:hypothetical protein
MCDMLRQRVFWLALGWEGMKFHHYPAAGASGYRRTPPEIGDNPLVPRPGVQRTGFPRFPFPVSERISGGFSPFD